jgi:predicted membrane chloride channel (bestrophin family)
VRLIGGAITGEYTEERFEQEMSGASGLEPADVRLPGICLYPALGFRSEITHDRHAERRRRVWRELGLEGKEVGT